MIVSGTTTERILRTGILTALVCGYSAWSLWDGYVAYPRANVESACRDKIGVDPPRPLPASDPALTEARIGRIAPGTSLEDLEARLGPPAIRHEEHAYYFGYGGLVDIRLSASSVAEITWIDGPKHHATDLMLQKFIGFALLPLGAFLFVMFVRVVRTKAVLDESGLKVPGRPVIPFAAMTDVRPDPKGRAGRFELAYDLDRRRGVVVLDDYVVKETPAIVREICRQKSFADPRATPSSSEEESQASA